MIKAIILDVDGVIVGNKLNVNFPLPHKEVLSKLQEVHDSGIPLILCTAKFGFAIQEIIKQAGLKNPHITDGGALIIDPLSHKIIKKHVIEKQVVQEIIKLCLEKDIYLEVYTSDAYYVQNNQQSDFTKKRTDILQMEPQITESLSAIGEQEDIIKMIIFASGEDKDDVTKSEQVTNQFTDKIHFIWSYHPYIAPLNPGIITAPHVSKAAATLEVLKILGIETEEAMGVGDAASDWNFMELLKYVATLENGDSKIKELVKTKEGNYFIAPSIDENGMIEILSHFQNLIGSGK